MLLQTKVEDAICNTTPGIHKGREEVLVLSHRKSVAMRSLRISAQKVQGPALSVLPRQASSGPQSSVCRYLIKEVQGELYTCALMQFSYWPVCSGLGGGDCS